MHGIRPRDATRADADVCWRLHEATLRRHVEDTWGRWDEPGQRMRFATWFEPALLRIVEAGAAPIGFLKVDATGTPVRLLSVAIDPRHQRRGIGGTLVLDVAREAGARPVWLRVLKVNPARGLYRRLGFEVIEETSTHFEMLRRAEES